MKTKTDLAVEFGARKVKARMLLLKSLAHDVLAYLRGALAQKGTRGYRRPRSASQEEEKRGGER